MQLAGTVRGVNPSINRYLIWTDCGYVVADLVVADLVDGTVHRRNVLYGSLDDHGSVVC